MAHLWTPDTCRGGKCTLEIVDGHVSLIGIKELCPHHATMRAGLASDEELWTAILGKNRQKNIAISAAATALSVAPATLPFMVGADDRITIITGENTTRRTTARTAVDTAVGGAGRVIIA